MPVNPNGGSEHLVGPVLRACEFATAVYEAIQIDNPGAVVHLSDRGSYVRIHTGGRCVLTRATLSEVLGQTIELSEIQPYLNSFSGRITTGSDAVIWEHGGHRTQGEGAP
jgi:toluene monooxygenase system protein D